MKHSSSFSAVKQALAAALLVCSGGVVFAQTTPDTEGTAESGGVAVKEVDREDFADLAAAVPASSDIVKGLFPEDLDSPEKRKERESCERIIQSGFKCMPPARVTTRYSLPGANFAVGSWTLPDGMKAQLRAFAEVLRGRQAKAPAVRIDGHADATGAAETNLSLSQRRAESVRDYLVSLGVSPSLFVVQGFGSSKLRNAQEPSASENRRVEIARNLDWK
jgi:outer membrane protein OmpA-like peptidoglycan-associated protein